MVWAAEERWENSVVNTEIERSVPYRWKKSLLRAFCGESLVKAEMEYTLAIMGKGGVTCEIRPPKIAKGIPAVSVVRGE